MKKRKSSFLPPHDKRQHFVFSLVTLNSFRLPLNYPQDLSLAVISGMSDRPNERIFSSADEIVISQGLLSPRAEEELDLVLILSTFKKDFISDDLVTDEASGKFHKGWTPSPHIDFVGEDGDDIGGAKREFFSARLLSHRDEGYSSVMNGGSFDSGHLLYLVQKDDHSAVNAAVPDFLLHATQKTRSDFNAMFSDVLTDIYNTSLSQAIIPACFKATTIIPLPKKSPTSTLNDYRPIALTPIMMKCFERLVKAHITSCLPSTLDPFQFAYRPKRSTDDAIATALHLSLAHLENSNSYVRMLFIDFSSAFNTVIPQHLVNKLGEIGISTPLCNWLLDFLADRPQTVRVSKNSSETTIMNTGVPKGCVLSPLLFLLMTHDCCAKHNSNHIIKFADDTTVVGLISHDEDSAYREEVQQLIN
ncbi:hypothetical protein F2P81_005007 [Scophthalmus maximus]|uniref:Reverse transcriptase domain-containing protein n=1 Tax=Scophthalmus maximus TaxID=52904 RepID=A0A6A4TIY0_SCOMX|nr:hypothetical protein F2P81_005007 [Scophthalmus maximus]